MPPSTHKTGKAARKTRLEKAEARTEEAETRTEQARTRTEMAETRAEQAETRTEFAKTRTEQAETRTEQVETALEHRGEKLTDNPKELQHDSSKRLLSNGNAGDKSPLERLSDRQRAILQFIAEGQNTKQIAEILKVSPKTIEYHRGKLMLKLDVHDIPGLVRFAIRVGLLPQLN